jgi:hypothetical protein
MSEKKYRVDMEYDAPGVERQLFLAARPVEVATLDEVRPTVLGLQTWQEMLVGVPAEHVRIAVFAKDVRASKGSLERWSNLEDPSSFLLLAPGGQRIHVAYVCYHSQWAYKPTLVSCDACAGFSYPGNPTAGGNSYTARSAHGVGEVFRRVPCISGRSSCVTCSSMRSPSGKVAAV